MRLKAWTLVLALVAFACGGGEQAADQEMAEPAAQGAQPAGAAGAGATGTVHRVEMKGDPAAARYWYEPDQLTIGSGDVVQFVNISGFPHNVAFYQDSIPQGAQPVLEQAMAGRTIGPLNGSLLTDPNSTYDVAFGGAPAGAYRIYCVPHEAFGMRMTITVQ